MVKSVSCREVLRGCRPVSWSENFSNGKPVIDPQFCSLTTAPRRRASVVLSMFLAFILCLALPLRVQASKDKMNYGEGLIINVPLPEPEVAQVVEDVAQNGVIRGTKEYNKDEFVGGAKAANTSNVFPAWDQGGKVFYKVRTQAIDPRNFKDGGDVGTLVVRYVVLPQGASNTVLRIDALFEEDFRHTVHQSNGSVESAEYKDIREHLDSIEVMKAQTAEAQKERQEILQQRQSLAARKANNDAMAAASPQQSPMSAPVTMNSDSSNLAQAQAATSSESQVSEAPASAQMPPDQTSQGQALQGQPLQLQTLEERLKDLRKQVERLVKEPGAPLKSAPFHTASTLQLLTPGTEVLVVVSTPYWYGVETHEGQHGWILRDQLELLQ